MTAGRTLSSQIRVLLLVSGFAEHVRLPSDDPIEDFSEEDMATGSMAAAGRSPNKHPRTKSEEDSALLDRAADRCSARMDTKVESMMDRLEKRIDEKIDSKLGPVMDRISVLEKKPAAVREVAPLHCVTMVVLLVRDPHLLLRAARFTTAYVRLVGQGRAPSKCVLYALSGRLGRM